MARIKKQTCPRMLPIVSLHGTDYFIDLRLRQFREVTNPHNFIDFDTERGKQMCRECSIVCCPRCTSYEIVIEDVESIICEECGNVIPMLDD